MNRVGPGPYADSSLPSVPAFHDTIQPDCRSGTASLIEAEGKGAIYVDPPGPGVEQTDMSVRKRESRIAPADFAGVEGLDLHLVQSRAAAYAFDHAAPWRPHAEHARAREQR